MSCVIGAPPVPSYARQDSALSSLSLTPLSSPSQRIKRSVLEAHYGIVLAAPDEKQYGTIMDAPPTVSCFARTSVRCFDECFALSRVRGEESWLCLKRKSTTSVLAAI
jgi:hypothetical protein